MAYIKDVQVGSDTYLIEPALYIAPSKNGAAYTAALTNFSLVTGATVQAKFAATNDANATLNVNNTGAKEIHYNGAKITKEQFKVNHIYTLVYDGTQWQVVGDIDTNTKYDAMSVAEARTGTATSSRAIRADYLKTFLSTLGGSGLDFIHTSEKIELNHSNSVTAKTAYVDTATSASANGGKIKITDVKYDTEGHITGSQDRTIILSQTTYGAATNGGLSLNGTNFSIASSGVTNAMLAGSIENEKLTNSKVTIAGNNVSLGGSLAASTLVTSLGLSKAMRFIGVAANTITDGGTQDPGISGYSTKTAGDVVIDSASSREYVWSTTSKWELLGGDSSYKTTQTAVTDPTASTSTSTTFIDTISQNANGVITATKKTLPKYAGSSSAGGAATSAEKWTTACTLTIGNSGKSVDGSGNVSWSLTDIGAAASGHTHNYAGSDSVGGPALFTGKGTHTAAVTANEFTPAVGTMTIVGNVSNSTMTHNNNANAEMIIKTHPSSGTNYYEARLGFSGNGNLYYMPVNASTWKQVAYTDSNITGTAANVTGTIAIANGGTGATSASAAWTALGGGASGKHADNYFALAEHGTHVTAATVKNALGTGSDTTKYLNNKGEWAVPAYTTSLAWSAITNKPNLSTGNARIFYGTSNTAAGTAAKVVACSIYDTYTAGDILVVKFDNANTAGSPTLNVNSKGAKNIRKIYNGAVNTLNANGEITGTCMFVYDGTQWLLTNADYNNTYTIPTSFSITANATDGLWDITGSGGNNQVTYAVGAYSSKQTGASFYTGTTNPDGTTRLNYNGYLYATKLYSNGTEVSVSGHTHNYLSSISWSGDTNLKLKQSVNGAAATDVLQFAAGSNITLTGASGKITIAGTPDTKNTAGSTNSDSKLYLIGAASQAASPQTYSDAHVFETNGAFSAKTLGVNADTDDDKVTLLWNSNDNSLDFVFT